MALSMAMMQLCKSVPTISFHELMANMQAADCVMHMQRIAAFHALPLVYPT
jgi:hypothetical protein